MPIGIYKRTKPPWNKGTKGIMKPNSGSFQKGSKPKWTGKTRPNVSGENHWNWQGGLAKSKGHRNTLQHNREAKKKGNGGSHTAKEWEELKVKYSNTCLACKKQEPLIKLTKDHVIPIKLGGTNDIKNIQPLCASCNSSKKLKIIFYGK